VLVLNGSLPIINHDNFTTIERGMVMKEFQLCCIKEVPERLKGKVCAGQIVKIIAYKPNAVLFNKSRRTNKLYWRNTASIEREYVTLLNEMVSI